jgi:phage terminase Nu1 subunit (DNA packaging protein)
MAKPTKRLHTGNDDAGLITAEMAARLIMVEQREFDRLVRADWIAPESRSPVRYRLVAVVQGYLKYQEHERTRGRTVAEIAEHLGLSVKRVNELIDRNVIERQSRGDYDLDSCRLAYIKNLSATAAGRGAGGDGDATLAANRSRLVAAKAQAAELELQKSRGDWVPLAMVMGKVEARNMMTRERLLSIPGGTAHLLEGQSLHDIRETLTTVIYEALDELADPATWEERCADVRQYFNDAGAVFKFTLARISERLSQVVKHDDLEPALHRITDAIDTACSIVTAETQRC